MRNRIWPDRRDFEAALHLAETYKGVVPMFDDGEVAFARDEIGELYGLEGGAATVYRAKAAGGEYALKLFNRETEDRTGRYRLISEHLTTGSSPAFVEFLYQEHGILVADANGEPDWYPALRMAWCDGKPLDVAIRDAIDDGSFVAAQATRRWLDLLVELRSLGVAHGDLQHGNVLVRPDGSFALIDYDGMFVPTMAGVFTTASEEGLNSYQHPRRRGGGLPFDAGLDAVSALVVLATLVGLTPAIWAARPGEEGLVLTAEDLAAPEGSSRLALLERSDGHAKVVVALLRDALRSPEEASESLEQAAILFGVALTEPRRVHVEPQIRHDPVVLPTWAAQLNGSLLDDEPAVDPGAARTADTWGPADADAEPRGSAAPPPKAVTNGSRRASKAPGTTASAPGDRRRERPLTTQQQLTLLSAVAGLSLIRIGVLRRAPASRVVRQVDGLRARIGGDRPADVARRAKKAGLLPKVTWSSTTAATIELLLAGEDETSVAGRLGLPVHEVQQNVRLAVDAFAATDPAGVRLRDQIAELLPITGPPSARRGTGPAPDTKPKPKPTTRPRPRPPTPPTPPPPKADTQARRRSTSAASSRSASPTPSSRPAPRHPRSSPPPRPAPPQPSDEIVGVLFALALVVAIIAVLVLLLA